MNANSNFTLKLNLQKFLEQKYLFRFGFNFINLLYEQKTSIMKRVFECVPGSDGTVMKQEKYPMFYLRPEAENGHPINGGRARPQDEMGTTPESCRYFPCSK